MQFVHAISGFYCVDFDFDQHVVVTNVAVRLFSGTEPRSNPLQSRRTNILKVVSYIDILQGFKSSTQTKTNL